MITFGSLLLVAIYLSLFVLVWVRSSPWYRRCLWSLVLLAPVAILTWDIPVGHHRFKALCKEEGGLHVYRSSLPPASVIRLDATHWDEVAGRTVLSRHSSLDAVEARDVNAKTAQPPAYARYERSMQSLSQTGEPHAALEPLVTPLDQVAVRPTGKVTLVKGPSRADYVLTKEDEDRALRIHLTRQWLRKPDGTPVASMTSVFYSWTAPQNTLFGRTRTDSCFGGEQYLSEQLLQLIARSETK